MVRCFYGVFGEVWAASLAAISCCAASKFCLQGKATCEEPNAHSKKFKSERNFLDARRVVH